MHPAGSRESRSSGPDTDTAAMILPLGERTGAETEATPCSRSHRLRPPAAADPRESGGGESAFCRPRCIAGVLPGEQHLRGGPARMVSWEPIGMVSSRPLGRSAAATQTRVLTLTSPGLGGLPGDLAQSWRRDRRWRAAGPQPPRRRARQDEARGRSGPACRGPRGDGAPAPPRGDEPSVRPRPVPATRPASVAGPDSSAASTRAALSRTPTPDELSIL